MEELKRRKEEQQRWYELPVTLEDTERFIKGCLLSGVRSYLAIGYWLRRVHDERLYLEGGYASFEQYVEQVYSKDKGWASKCMRVNRQFSEGGNSPHLDKSYQGYSAYQLVELSYMSEEQREEASPDLSVKELRAMRKPKEITIPYVELPGQMSLETDFAELFPEQKSMTVTKEAEKEGVFEPSIEDIMPKSETEKVVMSQPKKQIEESATYVEIQEEGAEAPLEPLSAYGTSKRVYPEGSLIAVRGCEGGHDCFSCAMDCQIRQEERYCREAPMGNPFPCETAGYGYEELGQWCQFVNHDLAAHREGDGEPNPCCKQCTELCEYICSRAMKALAPQEETEDPSSLGTRIESIIKPDTYNRELLLEMIQKNQEMLNIMQDYWKLNQPKTYTKHVMIQEAYEYLLEKNDQKQDGLPAIQPELPVLKNNDQRKAFLDNYISWPLWIETEETGERYYRYDLPDETSIIVKVYHAMLFDYKITGIRYEERFKEGYGREEFYLLQPGKFFKDCETNRSALIEKLKEIQKKG